MSWRALFYTEEIPWKFDVDLFIRSVSRREVLHGGTLLTFRVPHWRHRGKGPHICHWWIYFTPKEDTMKVSCQNIYCKCVKKYGHSWGTWRVPFVPNLTPWGTGHAENLAGPVYILRNKSWKFHVRYIILSCLMNTWGCLSDWKKVRGPSDYLSEN